MKKAWIAAGAAALVAAVCAETTPLWPEGKIPDFQPNQIAAPSQDAGKKGFDRAAHRMPYLDWSPKPANPNGACVILISGGGYYTCCDMSKFLALIIDTINHDSSLAGLLNPIDRINRVVEKYRRGEKV